MEGSSNTDAQKNELQGLMDGGTDGVDDVDTREEQAFGDLREMGKKRTEVAWRVGLAMDNRQGRRRTRQYLVVR